MNGINRNTSIPLSAEEPSTEDLQEDANALPAIQPLLDLGANVTDDLSSYDTNDFSLLDDLPHIGQHVSHLSNQAKNHATQGQYLPTSAQPQMSTTPNLFGEQGFLNWHRTQPDHSSTTEIPNSSQAVSASTLLTTGISPQIQQEVWQSDPWQRDQQNQRWQGKYTPTQTTTSSSSWLTPAELTNYFAGQQNSQYQATEHQATSHSQAPSSGISPLSDISQPSPWDQQRPYMNNSSTSSSIPFSAPNASTTSAQGIQAHFVPPSAMAQHMPVLPPSTSDLLIPPLCQGGPPSHHLSQKISTRQTLAQQPRKQTTSHKRSRKAQETDQSIETKKMKKDSHLSTSSATMMPAATETQTKGSEIAGSSNLAANSESFTVPESICLSERRTIVSRISLSFEKLKSKKELLENIQNYESTVSYLTDLIDSVRPKILDALSLLMSMTEKESKVEDLLTNHKKLFKHKDYKSNYQANYLKELTTELNSYSDTKAKLDALLGKLLKLEQKIRNVL